MNPEKLPQFSQINIQQFPEQLTQLLQNSRSEIEALLANNEHYTWDNLIQPLDDLDDRLDQLWGPISHLNAVMNNPPLREAYNQCIPLLSEYSTELGQHTGLYQAMQQIYTSPQFATLLATQRKIIEDDLREFRLAGVALPEDKKPRFREIAKKLSQLTTQFSDNVLDATQAWTKHVTDKEQLAGIPAHALATAEQLAKEQGISGWLLTLDYPCFEAVVMHADNRSLREELYTAYVTRASDQGPYAGQYDNSQLMEEILRLRSDLATLLDFNDYVAYSLVTNMANTAEEVLQFLQDLVQRAKPQAQQEFAALRDFAKQQFAIDELAPWDISYYSEKLRQQQYDFSQEALRPFFPEPKVIEGMFAIVEKLYGVHVRACSGVDTWHPHVRFFELVNADGAVCGQLYMDLYARSHKRGGAWMDECISRRRLADNSIQLPVAYLTCNFAPPSGDNPALLSHEEVVTLFHELGHCLHHLLTQVDYLGASGINGVPWDAVELPSQFFENWCWQREALPLISGHYQTGEPLPQALLDKMLAAKQFQAAMHLVRQLEFTLFDLYIHRATEHPVPVQSILDDIRHQVAVVPAAVFNRFQHSFSHIFAGGYAAGYYSYLWAELLSCDAFSKFEEHGIFDPTTGRAFLQCILAQGGSREPMELFVDFRGRAPTIDALLRQHGIAE